MGMVGARGVCAWLHRSSRRMDGWVIGWMGKRDGTAGSVAVGSARRSAGEGKARRGEAWRGKARRRFKRRPMKQKGR